MRTFAIAAALITVTGAARAAEVHALITTAMKTAIAEIVPSFEHDSAAAHMSLR